MLDPKHVIVVFHTRAKSLLEFAHYFALLLLADPLGEDQAADAGFLLVGYGVDQISSYLLVAA